MGVGVSVVHDVFLRFKIDPSQDSSIGSISAWYRKGPGFKSQQGQEFFSESK